ncbi:MAG TPA: tripartite tricarboxylate transporter substrate-binding protein [Xanthobacteraceae bacterium]|nr:tripartite tricarboxylate transporter substrate-binding protein [Xanthobacteraceae bacterium]
MLNRRQALGTAIGAIAAGGATGAHAATIDTVVHVIVGFPAGGGTDIVARVLAQAIQGDYASGIVVEDRPGASARLAVEYVKNAPADGSVMLFTPDFPMTLYPSSFKALKYDPLKDFTAVGPAAKGSLVLVTGPGVPADVKTLKDFIAWCKANPGKANVADTSAGATPHFTTVMLGQEAKVTLTPVHYRGGAPAMEDLIGGHVPASVNPVSEVMAFASAGKIRALAVTGEKRTPFLPDVPTMKEQGFNVVVESMTGVFVPAKTPARIVEALNGAMRKATASKQMIDSLAKFGTEPTYMTTADFTAWIKEEIARWQPVVKTSGFKALD